MQQRHCNMLAAVCSLAEATAVAAAPHLSRSDLETCLVQQLQLQRWSPSDRQLIVASLASHLATCAHAEDGTLGISGIMQQQHHQLLSQSWQALDSGACEHGEARAWLQILAQLVQGHAPDLDIERCLEAAGQHLQVDDTAVVMAAIHLASVCLQAAVSPTRRPSTTSTITTAAGPAGRIGTPLPVAGPLPAAGSAAWPSPAAAAAPPPALPAHSANTGFKRARNDPFIAGSAGHALQHQQQQQQQQQLPGGLRPWQWRATYTGLLSYATGHANPAVRCAAFDAVRKALAALPATPGPSAPIPATADNLMPAYHAAAFDGLSDLSPQVQLAACRLASSVAAVIGPALLPAPSSMAAQSGGGRGHQRKAPATAGQGSGPWLLQHGSPLAVADHAFQRLCGLLLESSDSLRVAALEGLRGVAGSSSVRVKIQAATKKATVTVDADADAGSGPGVQRRGKHAGRGAGGAVSAVADLWLHDGSTGAFVHAVEDDSSQVRKALATTVAAVAASEVRASLPTTAVGGANSNSTSSSQQSSMSVLQHAADCLVDLLHDEVEAVREAAAAGLLAVIQELHVPCSDSGGGNAVESEQATAPPFYGQQQQQLQQQYLAVPQQQQQQHLPLQQQQHLQRAGRRRPVVTLLDEAHVDGMVSCLSDRSPAVREATRQVLLLAVQSDPSGLQACLQALVGCWIDHPLERACCEGWAAAAGKLHPNPATKQAAAFLQRSTQQAALSDQGDIEAATRLCQGVLRGALTVKPELRLEGHGLPADLVLEARQAALAQQQQQQQGQGQQGQGQGQEGQLGAQRQHDAGQGIGGDGVEDGVRFAPHSALQGVPHEVQFVPGLPALLCPQLTLPMLSSSLPDVWLQVELAEPSTPNDDSSPASTLLHIDPSAWYALENPDWPSSSIPSKTGINSWAAEPELELDVAGVWPGYERARLTARCCLVEARGRCPGLQGGGVGLQVLGTRAVGVPAIVDLVPV